MNEEQDNDKMESLCHGMGAPVGKLGDDFTDLETFDHPAQPKGTPSGRFYDIRPNLGARTIAWRLNRGLDDHPGWIAAKLLEEAGEVARALVGIHEGREGRGDLLQEAAQTIIVLSALVESVMPGADLFDAVETELRRLGA